jgi:hypothetical protein
MATTVVTSLPQYNGLSPKVSAAAAPVRSLVSFPNFPLLILMNFLDLIKLSIGSFPIIFPFDKLIAGLFKY